MSLFTSSRTWTWIWILEILVGAICVWAVTYLQIGDLRDLRAYVEAAKRILAQGDLYNTPDPTVALPYVYPPPLAILFQPFSQYDLKSIAYVWNASGYLSLIIATDLISRSITSLRQISPLARSICRAGVLFGVLIFPPTWLGWRLGQVHCFVLLSFSAALCAASGGRWSSFGGWVGVATWLRVSPAALIFTASRSKSIFRAAFGLAALSSLLMLTQICFGRPNDLIEYLTNPAVRISLRSLAMEANNIALGLQYPIGLLKLLLVVIVSAMFFARVRQSYDNRLTDCCNYVLLLVVIHIAAPILWIYHLVSFAPVFALALIPRLTSSTPRRYLPTYILLFVAYMIMGGDMDYWRVHSSSPMAATGMLVLQNLAIAAVAIPVWTLKCRANVT